MILIIIPVHNGSEYTRLCLEAIHRHTEDYEIVLVDNGSTEDLDKELEGFAVEHYLRNQENKGFPAAVNQGVDIAEGSEICILNNDVIVTPGWAEGLLDHKRAGFDIVGPCTNFALGLQQVRLPIYVDRYGLEREAQVFATNHLCDARPVNWVIGFCMVMARELFRTLGGFDEQFGLGNSEDIDFCMRARRAGYSIAIARDVYVHHFGGVTHKLLDLNYRELLQLNHKKLLEKWGENNEYFRQEIAEG